jgi:ceramide glucosyltransferase
MTCVFEPGVACAKYLGADFGLGALIAVRRTSLDAAGGFAPLAHYLADDYQLAHRISQNGQRIVLSDYVVDIVLSGESLKSVLLRLLRWSQTLKVCNPGGYLGLMFTYGTAWSALFCLESGPSAVGVSVMLGTAALRLTTAYIGAYRCLSDREFSRRLIMLPVCDILGFTMWITACFKRSVWWRGRRLRLHGDGRVFCGK